MSFDDLWSAYPAEHSPCQDANGDGAFENQCAIRVGVALTNFGYPMGGFNGVRCWQGHQPGHVLRGEELAAWLRTQPAPFGEPEVKANVDSNTYLGRRGLMFCRNFWGPGNQGDHIDLWNRTTMKTGDSSYISRSEQVWFWDFDRDAAGLV